MPTPPRRPAPSARTTPRARRAAPVERSFLDRYRRPLLYAGTAVVVLAVAGMLLLNFTRPAYACTVVFDPSPAPAATPAPVASGPSPSPAPPGFVQPDMGHVHVNPGTQVKYLYCPPASGRHYPEPAGPVKAGLYGPGDQVIPQGWIHNLEHGALVVLYKCPGEGCTDAGQQALRAFYEAAPASPICGIPPGRSGPVIARFDDMPWPFAVIVWDVVLPLQALDTAQANAFWERQGERFNPERQCALPTPTPGPTGTPAPTGTPVTSPAAPTGSPAASPAGTVPAPSASPAASPG